MRVMEKRNSRWVRFLGGKDLLFTLTALLLLGGVIFMFSRVSFIFHPLKVVFTTVLGPVVLSLFVYYLLDPLVSWLEKKGLKRLWGTILAFLLILIPLVVLVIWGSPLVLKQVENLVETFPTMVHQVSQAIDNFFTGTALEQVMDELSLSLDDLVSKASESFDTVLANAGATIGNIVSTVSGAFIVIFTAPLITFFLLKDPSKFNEFLMRLIPPRFKKDTEEILEALNVQVGAYLKGQFFVAIIDGILTIIGFLLIGMPYGVTMGIIVGITAFVPYVGPIVSFIPCAIIALTSSFKMLVLMVVVWAVVQLIVGNVVEPKVLGDHLVIHPITIALVLLIMGELFGVFGLVFGVPIYTVFKTFAVFLMKKFQQRYNRFYGYEGEYDEMDVKEETIPEE